MSTLTPDIILDNTKYRNLKDFRNSFETDLGYALSLTSISLLSLSSLELPSTTVHWKKYMQQLILKMCRNEQNLGLHIINLYPIFLTFRIVHGV